MSRKQFRSWYAILSGPGGELRGWIVTAPNRRDASKHAKRQVEEAFRGIWRVRTCEVASRETLRQAWSAFR